jgi:hypothetical protein
MELIYDPRELPGVTTVRPEVVGCYNSSQSYILKTVSLSQTTSFLIPEG